MTHHHSIHGWRLVTRWIALAALLLQVPTVVAHDMYSSWAETKLLNDKLEVTLTLGRSSAHDLLPNFRSRPPLDPQTFAAAAADLRALATGLLNITTAGKPLVLLSDTVRLSGDNDVTFTLTYDRPKSGPLRFTLTYLRGLVDGHVATLVVSNAQGDDLGWSPLTVDQPTFQVPVPPAAGTKKD